MTITDKFVEQVASSILKAAGSGLRLYTPINQAKILKATRAALEAALSALAQENERLNSEEPGTPLGRLAGIARFAQKRGLCTGSEAKPAELFVIERIRELESENEQLRIDKITLGNFGCLPAYRSQ